ncbi:MAG: restriction endonuclease [Armatimonadetes bacterium]|nr:restriction endonuclease [Armatimonadota bacterium]
MTSLISLRRKAFHTDILAELLSVDARGVASNADSSSTMSVKLAASIAAKLKSETGRDRLAGQTSGSKFETIVETYLKSTFLSLGHLRPGDWEIRKMGTRAKLGIAGFEQYGHLTQLALLASQNPELAVALGADYVIAPDVIIFRNPESDDSISAKDEIVDLDTARLTPLRKVNNALPSLHASISCKWTLRSDRAQNAKSEALNLVRNRKGHLPHVVAVTGEPMPSRIASLALGTGDLDCVYHFALPELQEALVECNDASGIDLVNNLVTGKRLKDIADLPLDLVI